MRFTIRQTLVAVAYLSLLALAVAKSHPNATSVVVTITIFMLAVSLVAAVRTKRGYWIGFVLFGWMYLMLEFGSLNPLLGGGQLLPSRILWYTIELTSDSAPSQTGAMGSGGGFGGGGFGGGAFGGGGFSGGVAFGGGAYGPPNMGYMLVARTASGFPTEQAQIAITHAFALMAALLGGLVGNYIDAKSVVAKHSLKGDP
jgi:hypothetical protein